MEYANSYNPQNAAIDKDTLEQLAPRCKLTLRKYYISLAKQDTSKVL